MTRKLQRRKEFFLFLLLFFLPFGQKTRAQCFQIETILVDACSPGNIEGENEMVRFRVGSAALDANNLSVSWPNGANAWSGICQNAATAALVSQINSTIINCGYLIEPPGGILPPNAEVILISSVSFNPVYNTFSELADTVYVIFHCGTNPNGNFANFGTGLRTLGMSFSAPAGCSQSVTYDRSLLSNNDGDIVHYDASGNPTYANQGCIAPYQIADPSWNPPSQICATGSVFDLNLFIVGTPGGTWDGPGITGSLLNTGAVTGIIDVTYTVGIPGCTTGNTSETHSIQLIPAGSAAWVTPGQLCASAAPIDLNLYVIGNVGGIWSGSGVSGNIFDPAGLSGPINVTYTFGSGFCFNSSTDIINVFPVPDPAWTTFDICASDAPVDLNTFVTGTLGGEWSGDGVSGSLFDPAGLSGPVSIRYDFSATSCTAMLNQDVTVNPIPDPSWTLPPPICHNNNPLNLNTLITGLPGGTWSGQGVNGTTFNPQGLSGSVAITYTATDPVTFCSASLTQDITVILSANAGWTSPGTLCDTDVSIDLNTLITGTPGGVWSGTGVSGSTFDPAGLNANIPINYTVGTGSCASSQVNFINVLSGGNPAFITSPLCNTDAPIDLNTLVTGTPGGTWSGTGVAGNTFDPAGLNGNIAVTYTLNNGNCSVSQTQNIPVSAGFNASWTAPASICDNDNPIDLNTLITGTPGGTWSGNGVNGNTFNPLGVSGAQTITYAVGSGSCAATQAQAITVNSAGNPQFIPMALCSNEPPINMDALLTGDPGGTWSGPGLTGSIFNPSGQSGIITLTYTLNANGCTADYTDSFSVTEASDAGFTLPAEICSNSAPLDLSTTLTGDAGGTWSGSGVNGNTFNPQGLNGITTITYTVGTGSCSDTQSETILVNTSGNATFNVAEVCEPDGMLDLNTLITGDAGGTWSGSGVSGNNFDPAGLNGNIAITYTVGSGTCADALTQNLVVWPAADANFTLPTEICDNGPELNLNTYLTGTAGGNWSGSGVNGNLFNPAGLSGLTIITYTVGGGNCISTLDQSITVTETGDASFNTSVVCTADGLLDLNTLITGDAGGVWSGAGVTASAFNPAGLNGNIPVTYTVGSGLCSIANTQNLNVIDAGNASFSLPASICEGELLVNLNDFVTGTAGGSWSGSGVSGEQFNGSGLVGNVTITYTAGTGTCTDVQSNSIAVIEVPPLPQANDVSYCSNEPAPVLEGLGLNGAEFTWYNAANPANALASGNTFALPPSAEGTFLLVQSLNGCSSQPLAVEVTLNTAPPVPFASGIALLCDGLLRQALSVNTPGTINWFLPNSGGIPFFTGNTLPAGTQIPPGASLSIAAEANGCISAFNNVVVNDPGVLSADILGDEVIYVCFNNGNAILNSAHPDFNLWSSGQTSQTITINNEGTYVLSRGNECGTARDTVEVVDASADADFYVAVPADAFVPSYVQPVDLSAEGQNCSWTLNGDSLTFGYAGVLINSAEDQEFTQICINEFGCADTVNRVIKLQLPASLYVPNSFTPNGDGLNDGWQPVGSRIKEMNIEIFNRWGELVAVISNPLGFWDGRSASGNPAPDGVYSYHLRARDMNLQDYDFFGAIFLNR